MLDVIKPFVLLFFIMDPLVSMVALLAFTDGKDEMELKRIALKAISVAAIVFLIFAFTGESLLKFIGLNLTSIRAAGGIILIILGIQLTLGLSFPKKKEDLSEAAVVIGTPLISGPAAIATTIIFVQDIGLVKTLLAGMLSLIAILTCLLLAPRVSKILGTSGMKVLSTMMGIVMISWGVQFLMASILFQLA